MKSPRTPNSPSAMLLNLRQLSHRRLQRNAALGEAITMQVAADGRRILWLPHLRPPFSFTGVDVSDPREPRVIAQTAFPHTAVCATAMGVAGSILAVGCETARPGLKPAGIDLFDVGIPEQPRHIAHWDASGPYSRGVRALWFTDGEYIHAASGAADFHPRDVKDDQCYIIIDVRNLSRPSEIGRWWVPGTREGDSEPTPRRIQDNFQVGRSGFRAHNAAVYDTRPDRAYIGYLDYGAITLDVSDKAHPRLVSRWSNCPPSWGYTHTVLPLFSANVMLISEETVEDNAADWPKRVWVVSNSLETRPMTMGSLPMPSHEVFARRGGRFGAHNLHENVPIAGSWRSDAIVFGTFYNAGLRVFDVSDVHRPEEIAYFVPVETDSNRPTLELNDVFVEDRGIAYTVERSGAGLYALEIDF